MKGNQGHVTLRLVQAMVPESITIEHASPLLVKDRNSSAPKTIRVVGYPPCAARDDAKCRGLGFDANRWRVLGTVTYNIEASSSLQTFPLVLEEEDQGGPGSCSEEVPSCGDDDDDPRMSDILAQQSSSTYNKKKRDDSIAAVTLEILNNWGNEDYTCIYRFRLHGQLKKVSPPPSF
jgi:hypothetical protein